MRAVNLLFALYLLALFSGCSHADGSMAEADRSPQDGFLAGAEGVRIHYQVVGSGPVIVVVHGGPGAGIESVRPEFLPLTEQFRVIFYDQRGGGLSELPTDTSLLGFRHHVEDLEAVRRYFDLKKMTLVGHSFGALLVASYAEEYPDRVERMVFSGAVGPRRAQAAQAAQKPAPAPDPVIRERFAAVLESLLNGTSADPVADCREYEALGREMAISRGESGAWRGTACAMPPEAIRYYFHHTARIGPQSLGDWDFTDSLVHVDAPLLVIHGALDVAGADSQKGWARAAPHGRMLIIPGAGKGASADRPDLFFSAVETFLKGDWPAGASRP